MEAGTNWNQLDKIYFGGDYNPDQWPEEIWDIDMQEMKNLGVNVITLPVLSWASLQSDDDTYHFEWLDTIIQKASENNIFVNLATPTAAPPAWMVKKYPDILPVDKFGTKKKFGGRTQICPNSPSYRKMANTIAKKLAERYKNNSAIILWHVNNEYGTSCYCETCRQAFIKWLKDKYKTLDNLNQKWYTSFWSHVYYDWDEIQTVDNLTDLSPSSSGGRDSSFFQAMAIDYKRFMSDSILGCYKNEANEIKAITPDIPITTNIWGIAPWLDLFDFGEAVDVVSWDSYPTNEEHYSVSSFKHDIIRCLKKDSSFILMEQTPNQQNWQAYNSVKRPGVMRLMSYQTIAHGADAVLFFQIRQSRGACEKYHAAFIPHVGHTNTRIGRELKQLGSELDCLGNKLIHSKIKSKVAIMMNWENWWAVEYSSGPSIDLHYFDTLHKYYKILNSLNLSIDIVEPHEDLSNYDIIVAPLLNMVRDEDQKNIENYTKNGGIFISTYFSGVVDEYDLVRLNGYPGALRDLMGIWVEEVDALAKGDSNTLISTNLTVAGSEEYSCNLICEIIHLEGAKAIAQYGRDFYAHTPCVTENQFGNGKAIYLGTNADDKFLLSLFKHYLSEKNITSPFEILEDVEISIRYKDDEEYIFVMNHSTGAKKVALDKEYFNLLEHERVHRFISLNSKDVAILQNI